MMDWNDAWGLDQWLTMAAMMILVWGALIGGLVWVIALARRGERRRSDDEEPQRMLDQRFARGELTEDEYLSARSMLAAHAHPWKSA